MKDFIKLDFNPRITRSQLRELRYLLDKNKSLSENDDIMPFFRDNHQLSAFIGSYHPKINRFNRLAFEYDIFGDFTDAFEDRFTARNIDYMGLLIIGRNEHLEPREKKRLEWRQKNLILNSKQVYCMTFDELYDDLLFRLEKYQLAAEVDN